MLPPAQYKHIYSAYYLITIQTTVYSSSLHTFKKIFNNNIKLGTSHIIDILNTQWDTLSELSLFYQIC